MKRFLLPLAAIAITGLLLPTVRPAYACSCIYRTPEEKVQQADVIVLGVVDDVTFLGPVDEIISGLLSADRARHLTGRVQMQVEANLKGNGDGNLIVEQKGVNALRDADGTVRVQLLGGPNCALFDGIPAGERYLLFLYVNESGTYSTSTCSGSRWLRPVPGHTDTDDSFLAEYDKALGLSPGTLRSIANSPNTALPLLPATGSDDGMPWLPIGLSAAALLAASAFLLRRRLARR